jgi:acyl dehydratase
MPRLRLKDLTSQVGKEIGLSEWLEMTQERISAFAECTEDPQWIHVDQERARRSRLGSTVAHGFLLLSLLTRLSRDNILFKMKYRMAINYGLDRVRFLHPVRPGDRIRCRTVLKRADRRGFRKVLVKLENTVEIEGVEKPGLIAETLALFYL